jgi:predicted methyltransferase
VRRELQVVEVGDVVVDATCGNGYDTKVLATLVGEAGTVHAVDVQPEALVKTAAKLEELKRRGFTLPAVHMHCRSHAEMADFVDHGSAALVVFNLGYLPGSDHSIVTTAKSTVAAIQAALQVQ